MRIQEWVAAWAIWASKPISSYELKRPESIPAFFYATLQGMIPAMTTTPKPPAQKRFIIPIPRENPFGAIAAMFKTSIGNLPAHLVIIFVVALVVSVLCGFFLKFTGPKHIDRNAYLVLEIKPEKDKPLLSDTALRGLWAYQGADHVVTLEMGNGVFELLLRYPEAPKVRYFVRGGYRAEGNVLILQQRKDLGSPFDPDYTIRFYPMSFSTLNLYAENNGQTMDWEIPNSQRKELKSGSLKLFDDLEAPVEWLKIGRVP